MKKLQMSLLLLLPTVVFGQDKVGFTEQYQVEIVMFLAAMVLLLAILALGVAYYALRAALDIKNPPEEEVKVSFWENFYTRFNQAAPEAAVMTSHEYDGIKELDNKLPPWWLYGFYITVIFAIVYMSYYHVFDGPSQEEQYVTEMQQAEENVQAYLASLGELIDETNVELLTEEADLAIGKEMFLKSCSACHGQNGEGGIGPNFTDLYYIHGGDVKDLFTVIKYGVPAKGMISWENQFSAVQMQQLASFIISLEGTDPPNQKEAQGEIYERKTEEES